MDIVKARPSSTIVLLRDTDEGIEVLILRRNKDIKFCGGIWVFPGGAVEPADELGDELLTAKKAAVRETMEEAGMEVEEKDLLPISKWVTPEQVPKRFSTWFFVAKAPSHIVNVDGSEITESLWAKPETAFDLHRKKEVDMLPPTIVSLLAIDQFSTVDEVLSHYTNKDPLVYLPRVCFRNDKLEMLYPGDAGYEAQDAENLSGRHRCIHEDDGWHYINEIGVVL